MFQPKREFQYNGETVKVVQNDPHESACWIFKVRDELKRTTEIEGIQGTAPDGKEVIVIESVEEIGHSPDLNDLTNYAENINILAQQVEYLNDNFPILRLDINNVQYGVRVEITLDLDEMRKADYPKILGPSGLKLETVEKWIEAMKEILDGNDLYDEEANKDLTLPEIMKLFQGEKHIPDSIQEAWKIANEVMGTELMHLPSLLGLINPDTLKKIIHEMIGVMATIKE